MKKLLAIIVLAVLVASVYAQEVGFSNKIEEAIANCVNCNVCPDGKSIEAGKVCLYLFWGKGCVNCAEEKAFLEDLKLKYPNLEVYEFEIYSSQENAKLWQDICKKYGIPAVGVPTTFVGDKAFVGFTKSDGTGVGLVLNIILAALGVFLLAFVLVILFTKKIKIKARR